MPGLTGLSGISGVSGLFGGNYRAKVLETEPIAYWMLAEVAGLVAQDEINSPLQDGAYTGVTLGQPGIGDGRTSVFLDGVTDYTNIYSVSLNGAFDRDLYTVAGWIRVANVGIWTDGVVSYPFYITSDAINNFIYIAKSNANNAIQFIHRAGGVTDFVNLGGLTTVDWFHVALTVTQAGNEMRAYYQGAQTGATQVGINVWVGALAVARTLLGARLNVPLNPFPGYLAHWAIWDYILTPTQIAGLAVV